MKSADYVFQVCKAYRQVIDNPKNIQNAARMLELDMGREKTAWFLGGKVNGGITDDPSIGIVVGEVIDIDRKTITFTSSVQLENGYRVRIRKCQRR